MNVYVIVEKSEPLSTTYRRVCGVGFKTKKSAENYIKNCLVKLTNPEIIEIGVYE